MRRSGQCALFSFISHDQQSVGRTLAVLKSLLFQALEVFPSLQSLLPDTSQPEHARLAKDHNFLRDVLCKVLTSIGPAFLVLDGLDELEEVGWRDLLSTVLEIKEKCVELKILVSSRDVRGIARMLEKDAVTVRVDEHNNEDIQLFVRAESDSLLLELEYCGASKADCSAIRVALESIAEKSEGKNSLPTFSCLWFMADSAPEACFFMRNSSCLSSKTTEHFLRFNPKFKTCLRV